MSDSLQNALIRILNGRDQTVGTGFLVGQTGLAVTCTHVVAASGAGNRVQVILQSTGDRLQADIVPQWQRPTDAEDVTVLRLPASLPPQAVGLPLGTSSGASGHTFTSRGYRKAAVFPEGLAATGHIQGRVVRRSHGRDLPALQLTSRQIDGGMSGAPVWDRQARRVVGMINAFWHAVGPADADLALAVPAETLQAVCTEFALGDLCPYQGLQPFAPAAAEFYFGREPEVAALLDHVRAGTRLVTVLGPSGSGKSSLLRAGLLARLNAEHGLDDHPAMLLQLDADPFAGLAAAGLSGADGDLTTAVSAWLDTHPTAARLILALDQFEALFTLAAPDVRARFVAELDRLLAGPLPVSVILTLRNDFYPYLDSQARPLLQRLEAERGIVNVSAHLDRDQLRAIVVRPAEAVGLQFDPGLVDAILDDVVDTGRGQTRGRTAVLPLLEFALTQLWEARVDGLLTSRAYREQIGGVSGSLNRWANQALHDLQQRGHDPEHLPRRLFTDLVFLGDDAAGTLTGRRPRTLGELCRTADDTVAVREIVHVLTDRRLLTTGDPAAGDRTLATVTIIHDALIWEWGRLQRWLDEDREFLLWRQRLQARLRDWQQLEFDAGGLLHGSFLAEALRWTSTQPGDALTAAERDFIMASQAYRSRQEAQARRRRSVVLAGVIVVALLMSLLAWFGLDRSSRLDDSLSAVNARSTALAQSVTDEARQAATAESASTRAVAAAAEAQRSEATAVAQRATAEAQRAEIERLNLASIAQSLASQASLQQIQTSQDERAALLARQAYLFSLRTDVRMDDQLSAALRATLNKPTFSNVLPAGQGSVRALAFDPAGGRLASLGADGSIRLWDLAAQPVALPAPGTDLPGKPEALTFSPDGSLFAVGLGATAESYLSLWNSDDPTEPFALVANEADVLNDLAFASDGRSIAVATGALLGNYGEVTIWDANQPAAAAVQTLVAEGSDVLSIAYSPDGRWLAAGAERGWLWLWDLTLPDATPQRFEVEDYLLSNVAFGPDGDLLAAGGSDGNVWLWNTADWDAAPQQLETQATAVSVLAFSPDGRWLASAGDNTVRLWSLPLSGSPVVLSGHTGGVNALAFSPDSAQLVSGGGDGVIRFWDLRTRRYDHLLLDANPEQVLHSVAFSPSGTLLASAGRVGDSSQQDYRIRLWDGASPVTAPLEFPGGAAALAFTLDGERLVSGIDTAVALWSTAAPTAEPRLLTGHADQFSVHAVAVSPDGRWLVSSSRDVFRFDRGFLLWSLEDLDAPPQRVDAVDQIVEALAFSPSNRWLATAGPVSRSVLDPAFTGIESIPAVVLYDMDNLAAPAAVLPAVVAPGAPGSAAGGAHTLVWLDADRELLVWAGADGRIQIWDLDRLDAAPALLLGHTALVTAVATAHGDRGPLLASGDSAGVILLWDLSDLDNLPAPATVGTHAGAVNALSFGATPDDAIGRGLLLASAGADGTLRLWDTDLGQLADRVCAVVWHNLTLDEWQQFVGTAVPYEPTCPDLPAVSGTADAD